MGLTEDLHDLVDNPPPPRFDLDDLMRPGRARRRVHPALLGIAGFVAVTLALVGGYALKPNSHSGQPTGFAATKPSATPSVTASATPTATPPDYDAVATRLDGVLATLPKSLHAPTDGSVKFKWQAMTGATPPVQYYASWTYQGITYGVSIYDSGERPNPAENGCKPPYAGELDCQRTVTKSGITYHLNNAKDKLDPVHHTKASLLEVLFYASDGRQVDVTENAGSHYVLPLTNTSAMATAAHNSGLTLKH